MTNKPHGIPAFLALLLVAGVARANTGTPTTATVVPGPQYRAGGLFRVLFGAQWRDAWTTPIEVPVLDLRSFDGGLKPLRRGGGLQTKNLRFESGNGGVWVFRSIDKEASRMLDEDTRESLVGELVQDLTSTAHPTAALVVAPLLQTAQILHATPQLAIIPDDPELLGEFRDFGGVLGLIEKRVDETHPGVRKAEDTFSMLARLERRPDEDVDAREYLRARSEIRGHRT